MHPGHEGLGILKTLPNDLESCVVTLKYMEVLWFDFPCSPTFYRVDVHNKMCVALVNICKNRIEKHTSLDIVVVIGSVCLLNS